MFSPNVACRSPSCLSLTRRLEGRLGRLDALGTKGRRGAGDLFDMLEERKGRRRHVDSGLQRRFEAIALDGDKPGLFPEPHFEYAVLLANGRLRFPERRLPLRLHWLRGPEL